jgi:hypothetical protein
MANNSGTNAPIVQISTAKKGNSEMLGAVEERCRR